MGGGGSMQHAINTIRNNRNLLKKRKKGFFKRDLSYAELKKYYKESTDPMTQGNGINSVNLQEIREKLVRERKRNLTVQLLIGSIIIAIVSIGLITFLSDKSYDRQKRIQPTVEVPHYITRNVFDENMYHGEQNLKLHEYFMAVGNYKKALKVNPENIQAEFGLAKAYAMACSRKKIYCDEAGSFINKMELKYSEQKSFTKLKNKYLSK